MIKVTKYTAYLEYMWEKIDHTVEVDWEFKSLDEMEIYRNCLEAEYIDEAYGSKVRILFEFTEHD